MGPKTLTKRPNKIKLKLKQKLNPLFIGVIIILGLLCLSFITSSGSGKVSAATGINHQINFQGKLVNTDGTNVTDGSYSIVFSIYTVSSGGANIWTETQSVTTSKGIFQVNLGSVTTLPGSIDFNTDNIYLGIKVGSDAEMTPRIQFTAVPQAFNSEKLGGLAAGSFAQLAASQTFTGTNTFQPTTNISSVKILQNSSGSFGNDVFDVQGSSGGGNNFIQVTSTAANQGAVTISSLGANNLSLNSGANILLTPATSGGTITIGAAGGNGIITLGSSTAAETVAIGAGTGGSTVNIANGIATATGNTVTIAGDVTGAGFTDTVNIATGNTTTTGTKVVHIADGTPGAGGANTVTIGSVTNASATTIQAGSGNINISPSGASNTGVIVKPGTDSTLAFQLQNNAGANILNADSTKTVLMVGTLSKASFFAAKADSTAGTGPRGIATGDFNGDGKPDVIATNYNVNSGTTASVFTNNGSGIPNAATSTLTTGTGPFGVATGDFNGDGKTDAIVVNDSSGTASVYINTGTGLPTAANYSLTAGTNPTGVSTGDFNGDGKTDVIITNRGSAGANGAYVYVNTGNGLPTTFTTSLTTGSGPYAVATGDFNGDGKTDAIVTNSGSTSAYAYINTGSGLPTAFTTNLTTGSTPEGVAVGDFNGDGKTDAIITNNGTTSAFVFTNTGSGLPTGVSSTLTTATSPFGVVTGDFNGDGKTDAMVTNNGSTNAYLYINSGSALATTFSSSLVTPTNPYAVTSGDYNGDGKTDVAMVSYASTTLSVFIDTADSLSVTGQTNVGRITAAGDIVAQGASLFQGSATVRNSVDSTSVFNIQNTAGSSFFGADSVNTKINVGTIGKSAFFGPKSDITANTTPWTVANADFNGDGKLDSIVTNNGTSGAGTTASVFINSGGALPSAATTTLTGLTGPRGLATGDFNGDGKPDAIVTNGGSTGANGASVFINTGSGLPTAATYTLTTGNLPTNVATGDFNGDGRTDVIIANNTANTLTVYINSGGVLPSAATSTITGLNSPWGIVTGDFNGDGKTDAMVSNLGATTAFVYINTGSSNPALVLPTAAPTTTLTTGNSPEGIATGDFNGDGKLDAILTNFADNTATVYINTGSGLPTGAQPTITTGAGPTNVATGDFNGDGKQDAMVTNSSTTTVGVFINTGTALPASPAPATSTITAGSGPGNIAAGDFNGDGKTDAIVTNGSTNTASVFINTADSLSITGQTNVGRITAAGDLIAQGSSLFQASTTVRNSVDSVVAFNVQNTAGSSFLAADSVNTKVNIGTIGKSSFFAPKIDSTTGTTPATVATGDFNGDGKQDAIVTNYNGNAGTTATVLINTGSGLPTSGTTINTGTGPYSVATGDFNGDGKTDAIITNFPGSTATVFINTGTGLSNATGATYTLTTGANPYNVATGDFNGDGKTDVIITNYGAGGTGNTASVFINTGSGLPSSAPTITTGTGPQAVATGDFNGDGKQDAIVTNSSTTTATVFTNTGSGLTSASSATINTGTNPVAVATGDFNGDGKQDAIITNYNSGTGNTASVFINTGSALPTNGTTITTPTGPYGVATGDFNGDGKTDAIVPIYNGGSGTTASVFINTGSALPITGTTITTGTGPTAVAVSDFNGDGKTDAIITNYGLAGAGTTASVFTNIADSLSVTGQTNTGRITAAGDAVFQGASLFQGSTVVRNSVDSTSVFNVQNTAGTSFFAADSLNTKISVGTIGKASFFALKSDSNVVASATFTNVASADFNGDGKPDAIATNYNANAGTTASVYINSGSGLPAAVTNTLTTGTGPYQVTTGDFNGDGKPDAVTVNYTSGTASVFINSGSGLPSAASYSLTTGTNPTGVATGDFNGDGKTDVIVANNANGAGTTASVFINTGSALPLTGSTITTGAGPYAVATGDFNGDGKTDAIVTNAGAGGVGTTASVFINTGTGLPATAPTITTGTYPVSVAVADFNGDGKADVAIANNTSQTASIFTNSGAALPSVASYSVNGLSSAYNVSAGDLNGDGRPDLIAANYGGGSGTNATVYINSAGTLSTTVTSTLTTGTGPDGITLADFNGDGKTDVVVANYTSNTLSTFLNSADSLSVVGQTNVGKLTTAGDLIAQGVINLKANANSTSAFTIQNALGGTLFNVDTLNSSVTVHSANNNNVAFLVQNSAGNNIISVDTTGNTGNLVTNASIELAVSGNWAAHATGASVAQSSAQSYFGNDSLQIGSGSTTNGGATQVLTSTLTASTQYNATFYAKANAIAATPPVIKAVYSVDNSAESVACANTATLEYRSWVKYTCTFVTPAAGITASNAIFIEATTASQTFFVDGVLVQPTASADPIYRDGKISLQGIISSPMVLQSGTDTSSAFTVNNKDGGQVFSVDTTDYNNLVDNPSFEVNTAGWTAVGTAPSIARDTSQQKFGLASQKVVSGTAANGGARYTFSSALATGTYTVSFSMLTTITDHSFIQVGYNNGTTDAFNTCTSSTIVPAGSASQAANVWVRYSCAMGSLTTPASLLITSTAINKTFYIDAVQVETGATATAYGLGQISLSGAIITPTSFKNQSNSTTAFLIQNSSSTNLLAVDTANNKITVGTSATTTTLLVLGVDSDATILTGSGASSVTNGPTEVDGAMFYSSTSKSFICGQNGVWVSCLGGLRSANTSPSTAVTAITDTNFTGGTNNSYSVPANDCQAGRVYRITTYGTYTNSTTATTGTLKIKFGATTLGTSPAFTLTVSTTHQWSFEGQITCIDSTHVEAQGHWIWFTAASTPVVAELLNTATIAQVVGNAQVITASAAVSQTTGAPSITQRQFVVEGLGP